MMSDIRLPVDCKLVNKNVMTLAGRTSMRLDRVHWQTLHEAAMEIGIHPIDMVVHIERNFAVNSGSRTSLVRTWLLLYLKNKISPVPGFLNYVPRPPTVSSD